MLKGSSSRAFRWGRLQAAAKAADGRESVVQQRSACWWFLATSA